jgi:hypothetical protein
MRILPRVHLPTSKAARRLWRKSRGHLKLRRIYYACEFGLFIAIYLLVFSGSRLHAIDSFGSRMDAFVSLGLVSLFIVVHVVARRSLLPRIERHYAPAPYDERKIFFDLGPGSQHVSTVGDLYQHLAERIRRALDASNAAIFTRDEKTGNFNLRVVASTHEADLAGRRLQLNQRAFVVRRLVNLSTPLVIEPREIETWSQALNALLPAQREERAGDHEVLRAIKSTILVQIKQRNELV